MRTAAPRRALAPIRARKCASPRLSPLGAIAAASAACAFATDARSFGCRIGRAQVGGGHFRRVAALQRDSHLQIAFSHLLVTVANSPTRCLGAANAAAISRREVRRSALAVSCTSPPPAPSPCRLNYLPPPGKLVPPRSPRVRRAPTPLLARLVAVPSDRDPAPCLLSSPSGALPPSPQAHRTVHGASARCSPTTSSSKGAPSPPPRRSLANSPPPLALRVPAHTTPTHPV